MRSTFAACGVAAGLKEYYQQQISMSEGGIKNRSAAAKVIACLGHKLLFIIQQLYSIGIYHGDL
jgi:hypothetical protein